MYQQYCSCSNDPLATRLQIAGRFVFDLHPCSLLTVRLIIWVISGQDWVLEDGMVNFENEQTLWCPRIRKV